MEVIPGGAAMTPARDRVTGLREHLPGRRSEPAGAGDRGSTSVYLVVFMIALVAMAGLVFDGGAALAARGQAASIAQQAARAGADAMTAASLRTAGAPTVDAAAGDAAAQAVLDAAGAQGHVDVAGRQVTVTVHEHRPAAILSAVGVDTVGGSATATAFALHGTTEGH